MHWGSYHRNEKQNSESFFNHDANLTYGTEVYFLCLRCWFLCMTSLAVTPSMLKTSVEFEVLLLNFGYTPGLYSCMVAETATKGVSSIK